MKTVLNILFILIFSVPASATVAIEFQFGGIEVPAGSIGVLVADTDGDGEFASPAQAEGSQLSFGEAIGGDVIIAVISQSGLANWGTQKGFATHLAVLDYASLGLAEGNDLMLHVFPQRAEGDVIRSGEPHLSYRTDEIGQRTSNSTMGFSLPADGGAHLLAVIGAQQGGQADLASLDLQSLPYQSGSVSFDRTLSPTARHAYFFELVTPGFFGLAGEGGPGFAVQLFGPDGEMVFTGGPTFGLSDTLPAGLYTLVLSRESGGSGDLAYGVDFSSSDLRFVVPDIAVGASLTSLIGNGIFNGAAGQTVTLTSKKARPVSGIAVIGNQGELPDTLAVRGSAGSALCGIAYFDGSGNVTAGILTGSYRTSELAQGDSPQILRVQFSPSKKKLTKKGKKRPRILKRTNSTLVRADSTQGPETMDAAAISVRTR